MYFSLSNASSSSSSSAAPGSRWLWTIFVTQLVMLHLVALVVVVVGADDTAEGTAAPEEDPETRERTLFFQTKRKIREIICTGKANEEQLDKLNACWTEHKNNRVPSTTQIEEWIKKMEESVKRCVSEDQKDITFEIAKPEHREILFLFCSSNFRDCVDERSPPFLRFRQHRSGATTEALPESDSESTTESDEPKFDHEKHRQQIQELMKCKREALGISK